MSDSHWDDATRAERDDSREPSRHRPSRTVTLDARGTVKQAVQPDCSPAMHNANWSSLRRDGVMAYDVETVLDHRTCLVCRGSFSRDVNVTTDEALVAIRKAGL